METALTVVATTGLRAVNALATPATQRLTNITTSAPSLPAMRSNMLDLYAQRTPISCPRKRTTTATTEFPSLARCSAKPNTDRDNPIADDPALEPDSDSKPTQNPSTPLSDQPISCSNSSNSSFSRGLVFDLGPESSWDGVEIGSPVVKRYLGDEEERWLMWYHGGDSVGLAVSSNGIHWERGTGPVRSSADVGSVMSCGKDWWAFDTMSIRPSEVVIMSSSKVKANNAVYWLYYTGYSSENVEFSDNFLGFDLRNPERARVDDGEKGKIFKSLPGLAMSQDGRHWARIEGEHHTGALFDVGSNGGESWDSLFVASPQVVFHASGDLRMYYHSFDAENGCFAIGMARSRDGIKWVKLGKIIGGGANGGFDECGAVNARVVRNGRDRNYLMVYEGVDANDGRSIGMAVSTDGLKNWQRVADGGAVLSPSDEGGWDCVGVGSPSLVQMDGDDDEWRLYYRGIGEGGRLGIGMAVSEGNEIRRFTRWTGFHL